MDSAELVERLHHLDPGGTLHLEQGVLARAFGETCLSQELIARIELIALENRCTFMYGEHGRANPAFVKDDIY